ncbi:hypothetical protein NGB36_19010 [Streptomyces sp. RB6PN25]|uniref:Uncharacterized protein n=1 Tax=Streptomyces humicola TaxID=2953240 RepID=A0ABT1PY87_9ACTN|nr:hypothetical protein [Streptomyces humicola]MCQ4082637.1 hypothetical protein [Streptomyces humicola]
MSADDRSAPAPEPEQPAEGNAAPSMSALLAAGQAAHAVCTPPAAPGERAENHEELDGPGRRNAA